MAITAAGVGSGLDINGIVTQLMSLERRPVYKLEDQVTKYESQLSAYGKIRSALSAFESAMEGLGSLDKFKAYAASSSDADVISATANSSAAAGIYNIDVTRLAQHHKVGSSLISDANNSFSGTLNITVDGTLMPVDLTGGLSLAGIRDKINNDLDNPGVTASLIYVNGGQHLILTSDESGEAGSITVDETSVVNTGTALGLATINKDELGNTILDAELFKLDAAFSVDGTYSITSSSNSISDVIDGLTLNLKAVGASTLQTTRDTDKITENVKAFVDAYNKLHKTIADAYKTDLNGDSSVRGIESSIRNVLYSAPGGLTGSYSYLSQIGILSNATTGELELDSTKLKTALDTDFNSVADLFAAEDQGYAFRLADMADSLLDSNGFVKKREEGIQTRIDSAENEILSWEARLELKETALRAKYASLDSLIGSMQGTMQFLANLG